LSLAYFIVREKGMAIALQNQSITYSKPHPLTKFYYRLFAPFKRLWWHIHAYSVIFGVMSLTALSLVALFIYDRSKVIPLLLQGWQSSTHPTSELPVSVKQQR
jgi:hypothetical protein